MSVTFSTSEPSDGHLNMSNSNARQVMLAAGLTPDPELCGSIEPADIPEVLRTITTRLAGSVSAFTRAPIDEGGELVGRSAQGNVVRLERGSVRLIDPGIDEEYVCRRLRELQSIFMNAKRGGRAVTWG